MGIDVGQLIAALKRADRLIEKMEPYIKDMALDADWFYNYNEHCIFMSPFRDKKRQE